MKKYSAFALVFAFIFLASTVSAVEYGSFYNPKRPNQYGTLKNFFIDAKNGNQFCEEEGYNEMDYGIIKCGEDESSYNDFNWEQQAWVSKSTGSKNQCYPLFSMIRCTR